MNVFDFILLAVVLVGLLLGYKRGFFGTITKPLKLIASVCLTIVISSPIINVWTRPFFTEKVEAWIYESLQGTIPETAEELPTAMKLLAELLGVSIDESGNILEALSQEIATPIGNLIAVVVTYLILFIIFMLLLTILIALLDVVFTTGFLGKVNKVLGLLLGGVIATVIACILANIVALISSSAASGVVTQFFKNINPFAIVMQF